MKQYCIRNHVASVNGGRESDASGDLVLGGQCGDWPALYGFVRARLAADVHAAAAADLVLLACWNANSPRFDQVPTWFLTTLLKLDLFIR